MAKNQEHKTPETKDDFLAFHRLDFYKSVAEIFAFGGSAAGTSCFVFPWDTLKTQRQLNPGLSYTAITREVMQNHGGVRGMYDGLFHSMPRQFLSSGVAGFIYDFIDERMKNTGVAGKIAVPVGAGLAETVVTLAFETCELPGKTKYVASNGAFETGFRGVLQRMQLAPHISGGVLARNIGYWGGAKAAEDLVAWSGVDIDPAYVGFFTGGAAGLGTLPIDVGITRAFGTKHGVVKCIVDTAKNEGARALFAGGGARVLLSAAYTTTFLLAKEWLKGKNTAEIETAPVIGPVLSPLATKYAVMQFGMLPEQHRRRLFREEEPLPKTFMELTEAEIMENTCFKARQERDGGKK